MCLSDFDTQSGFCQEDSPRTTEIAEARGAQAGAAIKGFASMFGLDKIVEKASETVQKANAKWLAAPMMEPWLQSEQNSVRNAVPK